LSRRSSSKLYLHWQTGLEEGFGPLNSPLFITSIKRSHHLSVGFFHKISQPFLDPKKAEAAAADVTALFLYHFS